MSVQVGCLGELLERMQCKGCGCVLQCLCAPFDFDALLASFLESTDKLQKARPKLPRFEGVR